uniref:Basic helix-loop-helix transcription factor n=1 Tax=Salvia miltiorrhiza TaxID=226208 RepID=A0A0H3YB27_SALMI|nr:basic helix-loop-helix transcription factor [Salvia miltiorrhiza]
MKRDGRQQDEIPISVPDFSIWDIGFDQILFHNDPTNLEVKNHKGNKIAGKLQEIEGSRISERLDKKIVHREIERQRRKEMADLHASLRSVLPSKCIKGTRSASDQIHEATKYIRYMQNKVRQLEMKRDSIKKSPEYEKQGLLRERGSSSKALPITVRVQRCTAGVEVLILAEGRSLHLSRILELLLDEGLNVVHCNCTKFDGRLHCTIQSEDVTSPSIDLQMLQVKLTSNIGKFSDQG